ncbi:MAG: ABC transporter permease [Thermoproteota archaeon]
MTKEWTEEIKRVFYIAEKDVRIYFLKAPNLTFGLLLPVVLYLAFSIGRTVEPEQTIPGLVAMTAFFGAGAIQAISLPLERRTGTFNMLLTAPTSLSTIILGKTLAGFFFGTILSLTYTVIMLPFTPLPNLPLFLLGVLCSSLMFSAFGLALSAPFRDIPQAMPPATVVRIAMAFLSGVFIPINTMPPPLQTAAYLSPLTYAVDALHQTMNGTLNNQMFLIDLAIQILYTLLFLMVTVQLLKRKIE